ncbi:MAG: GNAT family N-acetyltransferase [Rhizobacter sp.]|nr:GNAT family N-acetyltransferase [Rhizobacter sp.]
MSAPAKDNTALPETAPPPPAAPLAPKTAAAWTWVPIRSLAPRHRERISSHLIALQGSDRYLRFGYAATDAQISKYVDMLDFEHDEVFGIFNRRLELIAMAHLAHPVATAADGGPTMSEFGVSVLPHARNRRFGKRLFEHAVLHARNRGVETLIIHALSENRAMLKIARNAGATVEREGSESEAWLKLPPDSLASHVGELMEHQAAELDYRFKLHARQVSTLLDVVAEVKTSLAKAVHVAGE